MANAHTTPKTWIAIDFKIAKQVTALKGIQPIQEVVTTTATPSHTCQSQATDDIYQGHSSTRVASCNQSLSEKV